MAKIEPSPWDYWVATTKATENAKLYQLAEKFGLENAIKILTLGKEKEITVFIAISLNYQSMFINIKMLSILYFILEKTNLEKEKAIVKKNKFTVCFFKFTAVFSE